MCHRTATFNTTPQNDPTFGAVKRCHNSLNSLNVWLKTKRPKSYAKLNTRIRSKVKGRQQQKSTHEILSTLAKMAQQKVFPSRKFFEGGVFVGNSSSHRFSLSLYLCGEMCAARESERNNILQYEGEGGTQVAYWRGCQNSPFVFTTDGSPPSIAFV